MKIAFSYLRVSSIGQIDGNGLTRQEENIRAFAKANGYKIVKTFSDEGVSGTTDGFSRQGLSDLIASVEEGVTILVESSDRIARDLLVGEVILAQFRDAGIPVFDTSGVELTNIEGDSTRTLIRQVLGAVAEFQKSQLVARLASARAHVKAQTGRCGGQKPYDDQETISKIVGLREEKVSIRGIAEILNGEGVPSPKGGTWHGTTVARVLKQAA